MADLFLSYIREDQDRVRRLVGDLRAAGIAVWWDDDIPPDAPWEATIERELAAAKAVIVCWSPNSVASENVRAEARWAKANDRLIQVFIERCDPPLFFGERQGFDLSGDTRRADDPGLRRLIARLQERLATREVRPSPAAPPPVPVLVAIAPRPHLNRRAALVAGGAAIIATAGATGWLVSRRAHGTADDASVAVMPFANLSGDPAQAYFSDGMAEELRNALSRLPGVKVTARTSSEKLRDDDAVDAAKRLDVAHILTGSVRRSPSLVRVNAQLVDGASGVERWSQSYDRAPGDTLSIQTGVAQNVAQALSVTLGLQGKEAFAAGGTRNAGAHDLYLKAYANFHNTGTEADVRQTLALVDAALTLDPGYALAHVLRARTLSWLAGTFAHDAAGAHADYAQALAAARRAIELAPDLAPAHATLAAIYADQLDIRAALGEYRRAAALGDDGAFLLSYSIFLARLGRSHAAVALAAKAVALDPLNPATISDEAWVLFMARQYEQSIATSSRSLAMLPGQNQPRYLTALSLLILGRLAEARAALALLPADNPNRLTSEAILAAKAGDRAGSDRALQRLEQIGGDSASFQYAEIFTQRGDTDRAFAALDRAWALRDPGLLSLRITRFLDPIRADPRFKVLEAKLDLP